MSNFFPRIKGFLIFPVFFHPFHFTAARSCVFFSILSTSPQPGHVFVQFLPAEKRLPHISGVFPSFPLHRSQIMCLTKFHNLDDLSVADPGFSPGGCANSQNCYYFSNFCRKLHENEIIWTPRGGARPWRPP